MFQNREEAGKLLATKLQEYKKSSKSIVIAIPRGGVVVARQIADKLSLPLSVVVVKKLGAPGNSELAIGAMAPEDIKYIDWEMALRSGVDQEYLDYVLKDKSKEIREREKKLGTKNLELRTKNKKIFILVDDGVATGATTLVAIKYIKESQKSKVKSQKYKIILAVPVIAKDTYNRLQSEVDKIVVLGVPEYFGAVGEFYGEFPQVSDDTVIKLLRN